MAANKGALMILGLGAGVLALLALGGTASAAEQEEPEGDLPEGPTDVPVSVPRTPVAEPKINGFTRSSALAAFNALMAEMDEFGETEMSVDEMMALWEALEGFQLHDEADELTALINSTIEVESAPPPRVAIAPGTPEAEEAGFIEVPQPPIPIVQPDGSVIMIPQPPLIVPV